MQTKHTPGPWRVTDKHPTRACLDISARYDGDVAVIFNYRANKPGERDPQADADARLIASAPDLLRVLTMYLNVDDDGDGFICAEAMDEVRAAIAKATGTPC